MYLNIILTILCLILLSMIVSLIYFWKKYLKKFFNNSNSSFTNQVPPNFNSKPNLEESFKFLNEMMKNLPKR